MALESGATSDSAEASPEPGERRLRLVLGQPFTLMLEALEHVLEEAGFQVSGCCERVADLERCLQLHDPDIALVDTLLAGDGDITGLIQAARRGLAHGRLVLLVPEVSPALAHDALALDVDGVLLKTSCCDSAVGALQRIAAGDAVFPAGWLAAARHARTSGLDLLSSRQLEVLDLLAQGLPNELIAKRLFISRNTVKFHVAAIYQRLGVSNRVQAAQALGTLRSAG